MRRHRVRCRLRSSLTHRAGALAPRRLRLRRRPRAAAAWCALPVVLSRASRRPSAALRVAPAVAAWMAADRRGAVRSLPGWSAACSRRCARGFIASPDASVERVPSSRIPRGSARLTTSLRSDAAYASSAALSWPTWHYHALVPGVVVSQAAAVPSRAVDGTDGATSLASGADTLAAAHGYGIPGGTPPGPPAAETRHPWWTRGAWPAWHPVPVRARAPASSHARLPGGGSVRTRLPPRHPTRDARTWASAGGDAQSRLPVAAMTRSRGGDWHPNGGPSRHVERGRTQRAAGSDSMPVSRPRRVARSPAR